MAVAFPRPKLPPKRPPASSFAKQISLRQTFKLTPEETESFHELGRSRWPREGVAFKFWQGVAAGRGLDYTTILGNEVHHGKPITFSALPLNHGQAAWCWPDALVIAKKPPPKYLEERPHA